MSETPLFEEIRAASAWVIERARFVEIRRDRLPSRARELASLPSLRLFLDPRYHYLGRGDDTLAYVLCLDAINFGSGWFRWLVERPGLGGYFTLAASLKKRFEEGGALSAAELREIDAARCSRIFGQDGAAEPIAELMEHFAEAWRQLGRLLETRFGGDCRRLVAAAGGSAGRLVEILSRMPSFDDVARYPDRDGRRVPFFKRAQLAAVDLSLAFSGEGPGRFDDLDRLTIFADNQVPRVLRAAGLLEYEASLAERVDRGDEIAAGSRPEIEIRAGAVRVVELLVAELEKLGAPKAAWQLDQLLWHRGLDLGAGAPPAHRTRTIYY